MFGDRLLVAPVDYARDRFRHVYLPPGAWRDFWTGEAYEGGTVHRVPAPPDMLPLFARGGAIIPFLDPSPDTLLPAAEPGIRQAGPDLRLAIYPGADGELVLYDGTRLAWRE